MSVTVKLIGALRHDANAETILVPYRRGLSLRSLIEEITTEKPALKRSLGNPQPGEGLNALVLVNSKEISALDGLETKLKDGDEVVLVPVVHGG